MMLMRAVELASMWYDCGMLVDERERRGIMFATHPLLAYETLHLPYSLCLLMQGSPSDRNTGSVLPRFGNGQGQGEGGNVIDCMKNVYHNILHCINACVKGRAAVMVAFL